MKPFLRRPIIAALCTTGILSLPLNAMASAFQLWEQDGASVGNYHAGYAAYANDASTAWYNPAGITRIKNQQLVIGGAIIIPHFEYDGSVSVSNTFPEPLPPIDTIVFRNVKAQGGTFNFIPNVHYVAPINDVVGFGFSVDVPFGLKTDYGDNTPLRYAATKTSIEVIDLSPSLGFKLNEHASFGVGFDVQRAFAEFNSVARSTLFDDTDTTSTNKARDTGYGYHLGGLWEFNPDTRIGISYHSKVEHHLKGHSTFSGPLADELNGGDITSKAFTNITLPAYTAVSAYHRVIPKVALMGSVIYTQWRTFNSLTLNGVSGLVNQPVPIIIAPSQNIQIVIPEKYRNTWNVSFGADYFLTDSITLRGGVGFDESPVQNAYRNVQLPDGNRYVIALGTHYQATRALGLDLGWTHVFVHPVNINPPPQVMGAQITETHGRAKGGADVFGGQLTWDIV